VITDVHEERLLVTSDSHIGSLFCDARRGLTAFLDYARVNKYNVCINGDGIDTQYTSIRKLSTESARLLRDLRRISEEITIYYTIGNHDLVLEQYLGDWGGLRLVPFLNVQSGTQRIRIEHGHLYDAVLMRHQEVRYGFIWLMTSLFRVYPPAYHWHAKVESTKYRLRRHLRKSEPSEHDSPATRDVDPAYLEAAEELAQRGFDAVILGHTHKAGEQPLNRGRARYLNTGSWFHAPQFVAITNGEIELKPWTPR
jgi:UDP-2,3-diacylglucosamine pyrophosphatase LpxH